MTNSALLFIGILLVGFKTNSQNMVTQTYKTVDSINLEMDILYPKDSLRGENYPAIVFFFGGGWIQGNKSQFIHHAEYFASKGLVSILPDYRTEERHGTTPYESLKDAKSVMRYIKDHAQELHINPYKIIAAGGSAGGQLAAATDLIKQYNENTDNLNISPKPNALILFNPVLDNGPGGYGYERIGENYKHFSPIHNVKKGAAPTLILQGSNDDLIPKTTIEYYKLVMEKVGSRCDLILYPKQNHGFFNFKNKEYYEKTLIAANNFLISLGYILSE